MVRQQALTLAILLLGVSLASAENQPQGHTADQDNVVLQQYRTLRSDAKRDVFSQRELAEWCEENNLEAEARAHFLMAARLSDDADEQAHLRTAAGDVADEHRWLSPAEATARRTLEESRQRSWQLYAEEIRGYRQTLEHKASDAVKRQLTEFSGPHAAWLIGRVFADSQGRAAFAAIEALAARDTVESAAVLGDLAIEGRDKYVRRAAARALQQSEPQRYVPSWLDRLHTPLQISSSRDTSRVDGEWSDVTTTWLVTSETRSARKRARLTTNADLQIVASGNSRIVVDLPGGFAESRLIADQLNAAQRDINALSSRERRELEEQAQRQLDRESLAILQRLRRQVDEQNARVIAALTQALKRRPVSEDPPAIWNWWQDFNGLASIGPATEKDLIEISEDERRNVAVTVEVPEFVTRHSCFVAGTLVWTDRGPQPIEQLTIGDRVLSHDFRTGEQTWSCVLYPTRRFTKHIYDLRFLNESIRASAGHPVWDLMAGWTRVKHLDGGEVLKTLSGSTWLESIEPIADEQTLSEPVFNLVVDQTHTYYVGRSKLLVHDDTVIVPRNEVDVFAINSQTTSE